VKVARIKVVSVKLVNLKVVKSVTVVASIWRVLKREKDNCFTPEVFKFAIKMESSCFPPLNEYCTARLQALLFLGYD
jgi:hypothetical protein